MANTTNAQSVEIPVDSIVETKSNEYIFGISDSDVERLAEEIGEHGFTGSIDVIDLHNGTYQVFAGHQRLRAVRKLGWKTIPCTIAEDMPESELLRKLLASNILNRKISPLGYARAIDTYKKEVLSKEKFEGRTRDACAKFFNIGAGQVQRYEALLKVTPYVQELCDKGEISLAPLAETSVFSQEQYAELEKQIRQFRAHNSELSLSPNLLTGIIRSIRDEAKRKEEKQKLAEAQQRLDMEEELPAAKELLPDESTYDETESDETDMNHPDEDSGAVFAGNDETADSDETYSVPLGQPLFPEEDVPVVSRTPNFYAEELDRLSLGTSIAGVPIQEGPAEDDFDFGDDEVTEQAPGSSRGVTGYAIIQACNTLVTLSQQETDLLPDADILSALERGEAALKSIKAAIKDR